MNATVNILCYKSKTLANGENPLMIRICKDGKKKYLSLGISVNPKYWDFKKNIPKRNCPNGEEIKQIIAERSKEFQEQIFEFRREDKDYTATKLVEKVNNSIKAQTVAEVFDLYMGSTSVFLCNITQLPGYHQIPYHGLAYQYQNTCF